jgi:diacylglycerol kinase (ATP)
MHENPLVQFRYFLRSRARSFRYAFTGWGYVIRTQRNAWIHSLFSLLALGLAFWLEVRPSELALVILTITFVWTAEFLNTALEAIVDLTSPHQHPLAKVGKDVGAAAVLIAALASVLVGLLILGPPLLEKLGF